MGAKIFLFIKTVYSFITLTVLALSGSVFQLSSLYERVITFRVSLYESKYTKKKRDNGAIIYNLT